MPLEVLLRRDFYAASGLLVRLVDDFKGVVICSWGFVFGVGLPDVVSHGAGDLGQELMDLVGGALGNQLHAAVGQVAHKANYRIVLRDSSSRIAEADALHVA